MTQELLNLIECDVSEITVSTSFTSCTAEM